MHIYTDFEAWKHIHEQQTDSWNDITHNPLPQPNRVACTYSSASDIKIQDTNVQHLPRSFHRDSTPDMCMTLTLTSPPHTCASVLQAIPSASTLSVQPTKSQSMSTSTSPANPSECTPTNHSQCVFPLHQPFPPQQRLLLPSEKHTFMCHTCAKQYQHRSGLYKHIQQQRNGGNTSSHVNTIACKEDGCTYTFQYLAQLRTHLSEKHLFTFATTTKEFKSIAGKQ